MCEFISWIELDDDVLYLKNKDLQTSDGKKLIKYLKDCPEDIIGHGAIRKFYKIPNNRGTDKECTDFSSPKNFPPQIVKSIKTGQLSLLGVCPDILKAPAWEQYKKVEAPAWEQYKKVIAPAWEQYKKVIASALEQYKKVRAPAWEQYKKVEAPALEQYKKVRASALEQYKKVRAPALEQYKKVIASALEQYEKVIAPAFWKLAKDPKNRKKQWR